MQMKLELVPIPVADVERARAFYVDKLGWVVDHNTKIGDTIHMIQLTPPSSACSILISRGLPGIDDMQTGSLRALHLVVADVAKAREWVISRGIEVDPITDHGRGVKDAHFRDPDGNTWVLQEMSWRSADFTE